jgi:polyhydroxybutyrate depolymerase
MNKLTGLNALADREGFIVVYPQGLGKHWNDGRTVNARATSDVDDVSFLVALAGELGGEYNVDPNRVYACGISNGAMMSFRLGADRPDVFAAVAGVVGAVTEDLAADHPLRAPIPCLFMNGTDDPLVPYEGGDITLFGFKRGAVTSTPASVEWWLRGNGAAGATPTVTTYPDESPDDGCLAVREEYAGPGGADVVLVRVEGGGHTWPGGWQYLSERIVGKTCRDIDGSAVIWAFFAARPKR